MSSVGAMLAGEREREKGGSGCDNRLDFRGVMKDWLAISEGH